MLKAGHETARRACQADGGYEDVWGMTLRRVFFLARNSNRGRRSSSVVQGLLAKFCQKNYAESMSTMNISLPDALKNFVDEQVSTRGYGTSSEYVRELIRKDQDRQRLRALLLAGASSPEREPADGAYFEALRGLVRR